MRRMRWAGQKLNWRATAVIAAVLAVAGTVIAIPGQALAAGSPTPGASPAVICNERVVFIGARGSGQSYNTFNHVGPEVNEAIGVMGGYLRQKKISYGTIPLSYPAVSTKILTPDAKDFLNWNWYKSDHLDKFIGSINVGLKQATTDAAVVRALCPHTRIIMVGYSQGAMVMHQAELWLKAHNPAVFRLIVGTVLVADGNRQGNDKAKLFGTSPANGSGIQTWVTNTLRSGPHFAVVPEPASTANICNNSDLVCDTSLGGLMNFNNSAHIHATSYANCTPNNKCTYGPALKNGAAWVGKLVASKL